MNTKRNFIFATSKFPTRPIVLGRRLPMFQYLVEPVETLRAVEGDGDEDEVPVIRETTVLVTVVTFGVREMDPVAGPARYGLGRILKAAV